MSNIIGMFGAGIRVNRSRKGKESARRKRKRFNRIEGTHWVEGGIYRLTGHENSQNSKSQDNKNEVWGVKYIFKGWGGVEVSNNKRRKKKKDGRKIAR